MSALMTRGLLRRFSSPIRERYIYRTTSHLTATGGLQRAVPHQFERNTACIGARQKHISNAWFTSNAHSLSSDIGPGGRDYKPPNGRDLKLGKTIRILHDRLPSLLASPLPSEILSPQITLHLFPSTHPHLPTVSGRIAYTAALWTAPVAWGRVPVVGNVDLDILSERMVKNGDGSGAGTRTEKLIVKWKTCGNEDGNRKSLNQGESTSETIQKVAKIVEDTTQSDAEFSGLFIFEFDEEGRISTHTIEHAEEGRNWEKTTKVISVTDWLLGRAWGGRSGEGTPGLAFAPNEHEACRGPKKDR